MLIKGFTASCQVCSLTLWFLAWTCLIKMIEKHAYLRNHVLYHNQLSFIFFSCYFPPYLFFLFFKITFGFLMPSDLERNYINQHSHPYMFSVRHRQNRTKTRVTSTVNVCVICHGQLVWLQVCVCAQVTSWERWASRESWIQFFNYDWRDTIVR